MYISNLIICFFFIAHSLYVNENKVVLSFSNGQKLKVTQFYYDRTQHLNLL
jgi:hypothetical protein